MGKFESVSPFLVLPIRYVYLHVFQSKPGPVLRISTRLFIFQSPLNPERRCSLVQFMAGGGRRFNRPCCTWAFGVLRLDELPGTRLAANKDI